MEAVEHIADVIPFKRQNVEEINGQRVNLDRLSMAELVQLRHECELRLDAAKTDLFIVQDIIDMRSPDGGLVS